jgi:hypothetical protein
MTSKLTGVMSTLAAETSREPLWAALSDYYKLRETGLRDHANAAAAQFADSARIWSFEERKRFSLWLMDRTGWANSQTGRSKYPPRYSTGGAGLFAPFVVVESVLRPTLAEWAEKEPETPEPHFWRALYERNPWAHVAEALRIDPAYGPACAVKIELVLAAAEYDQHELPSFHLADPVKELNDLQEAQALAVHIKDPAERSQLEQKIAMRKEVAEDWIRLRDKLKGLGYEARCAIWQERYRRA